jgi:hypothetical protein
MMHTQCQKKVSLSILASAPLGLYFSVCDMSRLYVNTFFKHHFSLSKEKLNYNKAAFSRILFWLLAGLCWIGYHFYERRELHSSHGIVKKLFSNSMALTEKQAKSENNIMHSNMVCQSNFNWMWQNFTHFKDCTVRQNDCVLVPNYDLLVLEVVVLELQLLGEGLQLPNTSDTLTYLSWRVLVLSSSSCSSP